MTCLHLIEEKSLAGREAGDSLGGPSEEAPPVEAILVPSRGACSRKQRKEAGSGLPRENRELGRPQLQVQPLRSSGPARCSETFTVLVGTIQVYNCVHLADKKTELQRVRGLPCSHGTHYSPEVHGHPDGPASSTHSPHRDWLCLSTWAAGGPRLVPQGAVLLGGLSSAVQLLTP